MTESDQKQFLALFPAAFHAKATRALERLLAHYAEPHRVYHTFAHIQACLRHLAGVRDQLEDPVATELALWFHDVIYDPHRSDNETQSARMADEELSTLGVSEDTRRKVYDLIVLTQHPSVPRSTDGEYLLDIDLSILGADARPYEAYEKAIRREYQWVPEALYRQKRAQVLESFLQQPRIYHTPAFATVWEQKARENLQGSLYHLRQG